MKAGGAPEEVLEDARKQFQQQREGSVFWLWPENWRAFEVFSAFEGAWNCVPLSHPMAGSQVVYIGLDPTRLADVDQRLLPPDPAWPVPEPRELVRQLRILERAALPLLNGAR